MEIKAVAKKLVEEIEYEGRREVRIFDGTFKMALMNEFKNEGLDFSDEELEEFEEEVKEDFMELAEARGWRTEEFEEGILIKKGDKR
jgi:hypothetical protein